MVNFYRKNMAELYFGMATAALLFSLLLSSTVASFTMSRVIYSSGAIQSGSTVPLHVEGKDIKDAQGNTILLKGVNKAEFADDPDGIWYGDTSWSDTRVQIELNAMASWGVNVIRCHMAVEHWKYNQSEPYAAISNRDAIKRLLSFASDRGIYVIFDGYRVTNYWHGGDQDPLPYPPYQTSTGASSVIASEQEFVDWWASVAAELKEYNNVIFELWNEPYGNATAKASWFVVAQQCIDAIRATGAQQLIVFQWDMASWVNLNFPSIPGSFLTWVTEANLEDPLGNIVYSTHLYRFFNHIHYSLPSYLQAWNYTDIDRAFQYMKYYEVAATYPLLIGEIGANILHSGDELDRELAFLNNSISLFEQHGISYAYFWWRNIGQFALYSGTYVPNQAGQILETHLLG